MTNNQIRYIIETAQAGSINMAARNLFISQSALSNAIMSVEDEFNNKIFNRTSKGVTLTSFGKLFVAYITPINRQLMQLYAMRNANGSTAPLSFTVISNGFFYISDIIAALERRYRSSGINLAILEDYGGNMLEMIHNNSADLGVVRLWSCYRNNNLEQFSTMSLLYRPIAMLQIGVNISENNPLYGYEGQNITPDLLRNYPMILHESLHNGPYADILSRLGLPVPRNRFIVDSRATMYELLDVTNGYVLDSRNLESGAGPYETKHNRRWRFLPLENCTIYSEIGWLIDESTSISQVAKNFVSMLSNYLLRDITQMD